MTERRGLVLLGFFACLIFAVCVLSRNYFLWENFCQTNYDLGIFIEMIQKNAQGIINPYINVRQIGQFNDHWTAALSLLSPLHLLLPMPHFAFWLEVLFLVSVVFYLLRLESRGAITTYQFTFLSVFFFLNRDLFEAAYFPIHPATWSALGLIIWSGYIYQLDWSRSKIEARDQILLLLNYFLLTLMDEQNAYIGVSFALGLLLWTRLRAYGFVFLLFSATQVLWSSIGRREVFGPLFPYFRDRKITDPASFLQRYSEVGIESVKTVFLHFIILVPVFYLMRGRWKFESEKRQKLLLLISLFGPLLLGRLLTNGFGRHYDIALIAGWCGLFLILIPKAAYTKKAVLWSCVFFLALSVSKIKKAVTAPLFLEGLNCVRRNVDPLLFSERKEKLQNAFDLIAQRSAKEKSTELTHDSLNFKILAQSNLGPNLLVQFPFAKIYHLGDWKITNTETVDWIIFERGQLGEHISIGPDALEQIIAEIMDLPDMEFVHQDDGLFMAHGQIPLNILNEYFREQPQYE